MPHNKIHYSLEQKRELLSFFKLPLLENKETDYQEKFNTKCLGCGS